MGVKRLLEVPVGWDSLSRHLIEEHELAENVVDALDAEGLRSAHLHRHRLADHHLHDRERRHDHR